MLRRFKGPVESKRFMEGGYHLMKNIGLYGWLTKKNCQLKSSTRLEILLKVHSCRFENLPMIAIM